jgi:hypothetical protein
MHPLEVLPTFRPVRFGDYLEAQPRADAEGDDDVHFLLYAIVQYLGAPTSPR